MGEEGEGVRYKVGYRCSCGEFEGEYEVEVEGGAVDPREAMEHRRMIQHSSSGLSHQVTLTAVVVGPLPPLDRAKWEEQYKKP